jgi:Pvc16 N-terminal domain
MSNPLAVAAVTNTLVGLLDPWIHKDAELVDTRVTAAPLDKARENVNGNQLNVFLYQATLSPAWRNMGVPGQTRLNETGPPPLALNLYYLLTAYGRDNRDDLGHRVLGRAMLLLHDHPVLGASEIKAALADNDLWQQVERIRIAPQPLTIDEISKLWTTFQTQYRISVAYEVGVVLVDSGREASAPLPVLKRSPDALASIVPPFPTVEEVEIPHGRPSALLGDTLKLTGHDFAGDTVQLVFDSARLDEPKRLTPQPAATGAALEVTLPSDAQAKTEWPPGLYTVAVEVTDAGPPERTRTSDAVLLALAPALTGALPLHEVIAAGAASV